MITKLDQWDVWLHYAARFMGKAGVQPFNTGMEVEHSAGGYASRIFVSHLKKHVSKMTLW